MMKSSIVGKCLTDCQLSHLIKFDLISSMFPSLLDVILKNVSNECILFNAINK